MTAARFFLAWLFAAISVVNVAAAADCAGDARMDRWRRGEYRGANVWLGIDKSDVRVLADDWKVNLLRVQFQLSDERFENIASGGVSADPKLLSRITELVAHAREKNLSLVLDLHRLEGGAKGTKSRLWSDPAVRDRFVRFWRAMAEAFKGETVIVGFDLINEPTPVEVYRTEYKIRRGTLVDWNVLADQARAAIREKDSCVPVIVESVDWAKAARFRELEPMKDSRVVYSFHMYWPEEFALQGVNQYPKGASFPTLRGEKLLGPADVAENMKDVREFQCKNDAAIFVGEFSANYRGESKQRLLYIQTLMAEFGKYGWAWAYHAYKIWDGWMPDAAMLDALRSAVPAITQVTACPGRG